MSGGDTNRTENIAFMIKFVKTVEKHPSLWNNTLEENSKAGVTRFIWKIIAHEIRDTEHNCREHWRKICCEFVRSLEPYQFSSDKPKKTYYLAQYLSFLLPYLNMNNTQKNSNVSSLKKTNINNEDCVQIDTQTKNKNKKQISNDSVTPTTDAADCILIDDSSPTIEKIILPKKRKLELPEIFRMNTGTASIVKKQNQNESQNTDLMFFLSILPNFKKLDDRRKRNLKSKFLSMMNNMLDEQEG